MAIKIGFSVGGQAQEKVKVDVAVRKQAQPRRALVEVRFAARNNTLTYYNERFDLKVGDIVYVDGKLEGERGCVVGINYNFKIKLADYQQVVAVADRTVKGEFFVAGSHFVTFDRAALPVEQALGWFMPPTKEEDLVCGYDDTTFALDRPEEMDIRPEVAHRGHEYFMENKVTYLCLDGGRGTAVVEGKRAYTVEFEYRGGQIGRMVCSCPFTENCKHEFATMLQLRELLDRIHEAYGAQYEHSGYFAAILKGVLFAVAVDGMETGRFVL